ncbi:MAG: hypothetical protein ACLUSP_00510 [Christensenellales bacterium]
MIPDVSTANAREREGIEVCRQRRRQRRNNGGGIHRIALSPAKEKAESVLTDHTEVNAVVALNEWATLGAGEAVLGMNKSDEFSYRFRQQRCLPKGSRGAVDSLVLQNPYAMGYFSVKNAYLLSVGQAKRVTPLSKPSLLRGKICFRTTS